MVLDRGRIVADGSPASIKAYATDRVVAFRLTEESADALARIRALPSVTSVDVDADRVTVRTTDSDAVVAQVYRDGAVVRDLEISGAGLEDAFVALTAADPAA